MEDISRELEREIERAKPTPHKTSRKKKVLVVDDFGEMRSGTYLKVLVRFLAVTSLVFGLAAAGIYFLFDRLSEEHIHMKQELAKLEHRAKQLTDEKEILMARLVMAGEKPTLPTNMAAKEAVADTGDSPAVQLTQKSESKFTVNSHESPLNQDKVTEADQRHMLTEEAVEDQEQVIEMVEQDQKDQENDTGQMGAEGDDEKTVGSDMVRVEKFSLSKVPDREDLRVRFNIRNVKKGPGEISGRIFLVLKTASGTQDDWIVVPKASIKDGVPADYKRGQYFSISRFKPVRFTISSPSNFKELATAAVYIFNDEGQIMYKDVIEIALDEEN